MTEKAYIDSLIEKARIAQKQIEDYTQEQADAITRAVAKVVFDNKEVLSREAVDETRMGVFESKVRKHGYMANIWNYMKDKKSVGILEDDPINRVITIAKPMGVIACIAPSTNPTTTPAFNVMIALKGKNSAIVAPHPRAEKCTTHVVELMRFAVTALGAPADLIQVVEAPTIERTRLLMEGSDAVVATGGAEMVKAAYSSGRPSFGVGQGNVQVILDEDYEDIDLLIANIELNRTSDNGMPCTGEQMLFIPRAKKDRVISAFKDSGNVVIDDKADIENLREAFFINGAINRDIVGKVPKEALAAVGMNIKDTKLVLIELDKWGEAEALCREIMFPALRFVVYDKFEDAVARAKENLQLEGAGHSSIMYSKNADRILYAGMQLPVGRLVVEQTGASSTGGTYFNGLNPTLSIGCGTWGNNALCENLTYRHLLNVTKISYPIADAHVPDYEETWEAPEGSDGI